MKTMLVTILVTLARFVLVFITCMFLWGALPAVLPILKSTTVVSDSMHPIVKVGDIVFSLTAIEPADSIGRVTLFDDPQEDNRLVLHRVLYDNEDGTFVTKGDNNQSEDQVALPPENVLGIGMIRVPWAGFPYYWMQKKEMLPLAILVGTIIVMAMISNIKIPGEDKIKQTKTAIKSQKTGLSQKPKPQNS